MALKGHLVSGGLVGPLAGIESGSANDIAGFDGSSAATTRSLSDLLDAVIGDDQGTILYRGATEWDALAPADGYLKSTDGVLSYETIDPPVGLVVAGTPLVMNPVVISTTTSAQAHGLGVVPFYIDFRMECLTADLGYAVGDVVRGGFPKEFFTWIADATDLVLVSGANVPQVWRKDTQANGTITAARWKVTLTPYGLST